MLDLRALGFDETVALAIVARPAALPRRADLALGPRPRGRLDRRDDQPAARAAGELAERAAIGTLEVAEVQTSADGTRKLRLVTRDGSSIESVLIPDGDKTTQCISSQVGCAMDCSFCATAKLGLARNLDAGEIVDQVYRARKLLAEVEPGRRITNLVYMGMGEPLHNYDQVVASLRMLTHDLGAGLSQRRITVSTSGLVPRIERLGSETVRPNLAVSLNAASDEVRDEVMPVNRKWNIARLLAAIRAFPLEQRRRVTFEYVLLAGVNDSVADAARLAKLLRGIRCKVNVIPWNPHPEAPYGGRRRRRSRPSRTSASGSACRPTCARRAATTSTPPAASSPTAPRARPWSRCGGGPRRLRPEGRRHGVGGRGVGGRRAPGAGRTSWDGCPAVGLGRHRRDVEGAGGRRRDHQRGDLGDRAGVEQADQPVASIGASRTSAILRTGALTAVKLSSSSSSPATSWPVVAEAHDAEAAAGADHAGRRRLGLEAGPLDPDLVGVGAGPGDPRPRPGATARAANTRSIRGIGVAPSISSSGGAAGAGAGLASVATSLGAGRPECVVVDPAPGERRRPGRDLDLEPAPRSRATGTAPIRTDVRPTTT